MDLPKQFPYGPRLTALLLYCALGISFCAIPAFHRALWIFGIPGLFFLLGALAGTYRRIVVRPFIKFDSDKILFRWPSRTNELPYDRIRSFREGRYGRMKVLKLQTQERLFEINSTLLPDNETFDLIRTFLKSRVAPAPEEKKPKVPGAYVSRCAYEGMGEIYDSNGELLWRTKTLHFHKPHYPYGLFRIPDFVVCDKDEKEIFRIKAERNWIFPHFTMIRDGSPFCSIQSRSPLRNKHTLAFSNGEKWVFRMPLFTMHFKGVSESGGRISVRVRTHNIWQILINPESDRPELAAAIAFIHRERLRFN